MPKEKISTSKHGRRPLLHPLSLEQRRVRQRLYSKRHRQKIGPRSSARRVHLSGIRIDENLLGRLHRLTNEAIAKGTYPWRTLSQCIERLVIDGLRAWEGKTGDELIAEMLPHLETMQRLETYHQSKRESHLILNRAREEITDLAEIGSGDAALLCYHQTMDAIEEMPRTVWQTWLVKQMEKSFPAYAKAKDLPKIKIFQKPKRRSLLPKAKE